MSALSWAALVRGCDPLVGLPVRLVIVPATPPPCQINVPALRAQADGSGVVTGHVTGSCRFAWHSTNEIQYKDRWHTLGVNTHPGGAAGERVRQSIDREEYSEDGYWREVVLVYDKRGHFRQRIVGPVSEFKS